MARRTAIVFLGLLLAACAIDPQGGYTRIRDNAAPYDQAHAQCWERSMSLLGGLAMDMPRERAYAACMREAGWADMRMSAQPRPQTAPGSSGGR